MDGGFTVTEKQFSKNLNAYIDVHTFHS